MNNAIFLGVCCLIGAASGLIVLKLGSAKMALRVVLVWMLLSALALYAIGLAPHGFILFAFLPLWFGGFVSLVATLLRLNVEQNARIDRIESR